jgi:uncharacterized membrane protein
MSQSEKSPGTIVPEKATNPITSSDIETVLGRELESIVGPSKANDAAKRTIAVLHKTEVFSGPLPPPSILEHYDTITPGFADRIVAMAEKEQNHRHSIMAQEQRYNAEERKFGRWIALCFGLALLIAGSYCASIGQVAIGCSLFGVFGVTAIGLFIRGDGKIPPQSGKSQSAKQITTSKRPKSSNRRR